MKWNAMWALAPALLVTACHHGGNSGAANSSNAILRPAPDVAASSQFQLHQEAATAAGGPVATSKQYMLVLGSVANDNH